MRAYRLLALAIVACLFGAPAFAQKTRTWVDSPTITQSLTPGQWTLNANTAALSPHAATNAALKALAAGAYATVTRDGFATAGDGGGAVYNWSSSACSLNSGAGDNGYQVQPNSGTGCWIASFPATGADVRAWGAVADGVTDAGPAINTALANYHGTLILPATDSGFYINTTVLVTHTLAGTSMRPINNMGSSNLYPQQSWFLCSRTVNPCVRANSSGALSTGAQLENIIIAGASGTPNSGVVGLQFAGGYQTNTYNVFVVNFDWCVEWGPEGSVGGLGSTNYNLNAGACQTHYFVIDGWPEIRNIGGRAGLNGTGDYGASSDFVYITHTTTVGSGGGPNTIMFDDYHFNPGGSGGVACGINFGGWTGSGGGQNEFRFTNDHFEWHTYTGGLSQGIICSDSTVPAITQFWMSNMTGSTGGLTVPMFSLNSLTALNHVFFYDNDFACSAGLTLAPTPASGASFTSAHFSNNNNCGNASFTANGGSNTLFLNGNQWNTLTLAGTFTSLGVHGDHTTSLTDTSTGTKFVSTDANVTASGTISAPTIKGTTGGAFGANGNLSAFSKTWAEETEVDQNTDTYAGVVNNNTGANASAIYEFITGTPNSFAYWQLADHAGSPAYSLHLGSALGFWYSPPVVFSGTAPTCSSTGTGSSPSCSPTTGSNSTDGKILIVAGTSPSSSGTFTITPASALGTNTPVCSFWFNDSSTAWNSGAAIHAGASTTTLFTGNWWNNSVSLTGSSTYAIEYHCFGK